MTITDRALRRLALPIAAAAAVVIAAPASAQVAPGDTYNVALAGGNTASQNAYYVVSPLTPVFGTTQTYTGAGYGGQSVTVTSTQSISNGRITNFFSFSTPTNFLTSSTINGETINILELDLGFNFAGTNAVDLLNPALNATATGLLRYGTSSTLALTPGLTVGSNGLNYSFYEAVNTTAAAGLFQFGIRGFEATISYDAPAATPSVPEPATWGMLIAGFGLVGAAMRRRRVAVRFA